MSETSIQPPPKDEAAALGLVNVQVDGRWLRFPKGTRMIEAIHQAGIEVPHYCYHPKLSSPGNCRMCLVEQGMPPRPAPGQEPALDADGYQPIQWMPRPVISCANTVAENMGIRTDSPMVREVRNGVMEFLLANHPLDCPICDQAGECQLQEFSVGYGRGHSRFQEQKVKKPKNVPIGPRIRLDDERCIMCSRCIRFMNEVANDPVLGFTERGGFTTLGVHPDRPLDHNYGLNTVDICPVGALTSSDFRFQMRVWFLRETPTIDPHCGTGCNISVWTRENRIYRVTPRDNNAVNSSWLPDSHRLGFHQLREELRLTAPLHRPAGSPAHAEVAWPAAIQTLASSLRGQPAGSVAIVASARLTNEEMFLVRHLAAALGAPLLASVPRRAGSDGLLISDDRNPNSEGSRQILALDPDGSSLNALRDGLRSGTIQSVLSLHEDLTAEAGLTPEDLAQPAFLCYIGPLANPTASAAHLVLPAASHYEKRGTMINVTGRLQRLQTALTPPGEARLDWEILRDLALAAGAPPLPDTITGLSKAMAAALPVFDGHSLATAGALGVQLYQSGVTIPLLDMEADRVRRGEIVG